MHPAGSVRAELILSAVLALIVAGFSARAHLMRRR
jgi:hypothetical protein